jgi:hypothetical protein
LATIDNTRLRQEGKRDNSMPHDLDAEKPEPPVTLTESPSNVIDVPNKPEEPEVNNHQREFVIIPQDNEYKGPGNKFKRPTNLHPYTRPLTISDLESVVALENAAFPDLNERASREKVSSSSSTYISRPDIGGTRDHHPSSLNTL